jgi:hypothetical protein
VITIVGTKHRGIVCAFDRLEPNDACGKIGRLPQISNTEADIAKLFDRNHRLPLCCRKYCPKTASWTQMFFSAV